MKSIFIFDIDMTLADSSARDHLLKPVCSVCLSFTESTYCLHCSQHVNVKYTQESWDAFLDPSALVKDLPYAKAQEFINKLRNMGVPVHFITGRNERTREATSYWLSTHYGLLGTEELVMRPTSERGSKNHTRASVYKEKAFLGLEEKLGTKGSLYYFFEDDPYVFAVYKKYGIVIKCPEFWNLEIVDPTSANLLVEPNIRK